MELRPLESPQPLVKACTPCQKSPHHVLVLIYAKLKYKKINKINDLTKKIKKNHLKSMTYKKSYIFLKKTIDI